MTNGKFSAEEVLASALRTASGSAIFDVSFFKTFLALLNVTDVDGTSPTLDVKFQESADGTNFIDIPSAAYSQVTAAILKRLEVSSYAKYIKVVYTLGGTSIAAALSTNLTGANNDLTFTAKTAGTGGNSITITYVVSGLNTALAVNTVGNNITVTVATDGAGVATSTAAQVKTAIEANTAGNALVSITNKAANDGTGVVTALAQTNLAGGETVGATFDLQVSAKN
jgi:hypothetical protein